MSNENEHQVLLSTLKMNTSFRKATSDDERNLYNRSIAKFKWGLQLKIFENKAHELQQKIKMNDDDYDKAYRKASVCHDRLRELSDRFFNQEINFDNFSNLSNAAIDEAREELSHHRGWKQILGNLGLAIAGLGVFYPRSVTHA
jgi:hypothetical protein